MTLVNDMLSKLPSREGVAEILTARNALLILYGWIVYQLLRAAWNISPFHPLSRFPGPRLAAATYFPEYWHDFVKFGRYTHEIKRMHEIYGPLVRINPDEIHCNDFKFVDFVYAAGGRKRDKPPHQSRGSVWEGSGFMTLNHDHHRLRRSPLIKFFSKPQIAQYESHVRGHAQRLCDKIIVEGAKHEPFEIQDAYSSFTSDVISEYCFGKSFGFLSLEDGWTPNFRNPLYALLKTLYLFRFYPFLKHIFLALPLFLNYLPKDMAILIKTMRIDIPEQIAQAKTNAEAGSTDEKLPTIFKELLDSNLPASEKVPSRLLGEALTILGGGTETGSWTLSVITYFLLSQPQTLAKLADELHNAIPDPTNLPPWAELERLPYLYAVVQEGLRLSYGVSLRTARIAREEDLVYEGEWRGEKVEHVIPRGYAVGMSAVLIHHDESLFPDSYKFIPERWLDAKGRRDGEMERRQMAFSKGPRMCLGMNLALCEMYTITAAFAMRVFPHMRLYETTEDDVTYDHDLFVTATRRDSKGVRVVFA
ncbi:cytochrome P450 [Annulohypoxylon maeteangense]|uniref:cytochrome P450 n=1 Tax=Annulohypoxylon maeteangense TaxID=1927788 RepID=UPI0020083FA5|nr:cytochrome P450 [Annulohypoxylon maeteangense]KAI0889423.1 cytochrome P450 [Annulohypoxylon maeteangense]